MAFSLRRRGLRAQIAPIAPLLDIALAPATAAAALQMRLVREVGIKRLGWCRKTFERIGVYPIWDHYYEPLFKTSHLREHLEKRRDLPGIDLNLEAQRATLAGLGHQDELLAIPRTGAAPGHYAFDNGNFGPGDAEILYSLIRSRKPRRVIEVGSGYSTLVARRALVQNAEAGSPAEHVCIEPFEMAWLEATGVDVVRKRVEEIEPAFFEQLESGDVLFIDSSHMVRPRGDVLYLYQQVLPRLAAGVIVHIHDVFTPYDYPAEWLVDDVCFWNEQYLVETFLAFNSRFKVLLALHALFKEDFGALAAACPVLAEGNRVPRSLWIERT